MKKILLKLLFIALPLAIVTVSCDKDDFNENDLVGTWAMTSWESVEKADGVIINKDSETVTEVKDTIRYNKDRSFDEYDAGAWQNNSGTWSISGSYLLLDYAGDDPVKLRIEALTSNRLVLSQSYTKVEEGVTYAFSGSTTYVKR